MRCPKCFLPLPDANSFEGAWCPDCEEWWPYYDEEDYPTS